MMYGKEHPEENIEELMKFDNYEETGNIKDNFTLDEQAAYKQKQAMELQRLQQEKKI